MTHSAPAPKRYSLTTAVCLMGGADGGAGEGASDE